MSRPLSLSSFTPGTFRWAAMLIAAAAVLGCGLLLSAISGTIDAMSVAATVAVSVILVTAALWLPWRRWSNATSLALAVGALVLLLVAEATSGYAGSRPAGATYPLFVTLVLAWVGLTQPRRTALAFTLCVGATLAAALLLPATSAVPLSSLAVVLPAGAILGEAASWMMAQLRRIERRDSERADTFIDLTRAMDKLPERGERHAVAGTLADAASRLFETRAEVTLIAEDGSEITASSEQYRSSTELGVPAWRAAMETPATTGTISPPRRTTVTLMGERGLLGRVQLDRPRDPDDAYLTNLVRLFAGQSASALERFELVARLGHESTHDELTGTGNRRKANSLLTTLRHGDGVILIDVDRFKSLNDTAGHLAGDELLRTLGRYLTGYVREHDGVARLGGDEFVVVVRGVAQGAASAAGRLLEGWRTHHPEVTVSVGVAVHRGGDASEVTVARADQALYRAKRAGRNQVGLEPDEFDDRLS